MTTVASTQPVKIPGRAGHTRTPSLVDRQLRSHPAPDTDAVFRSDEQQLRSTSKQVLSNDEIIKSGWLLRRSKTRAWHKKWFVLRDYQLCYYKDETEYKVEGIVSTADIMTVAMATDSHKQHDSTKATHFVIFSSASNVHLKADNPDDAVAWCHVLKNVADAAAESMLSSSFQRMSAMDSYHEHRLNQFEQRQLEHSANEDYHLDNHSGSNTNTNTYNLLSSATEFSGPDDIGGMSSCTSENNMHENDTHEDMLPPIQITIPEESNEEDARDTAGATNAPDQDQDQDQDQSEEKIVMRGYLLRLKKRYNQWKRQYLVLTTDRAVFYKNDKHIATSKPPVKVIPLEHIVDVVETDPLSKSKRYCMIIITPEKRYRFCVDSEDDLTKWLASFKTVVSSRNS